MLFKGTMGGGRMNKKLINIVIIVLAVMLVLGVTKDVLLKVSIEKGTEVVTGLKLDIKSLRVGVVKTLIEIKDLKLYNPKGYKDAVMLNMPEIYVDYDFAAVIKGNIYLPVVRIHMEEFLVVKNEKGELNLDALKVVKEEKSGEEVPASKKKSGKAPEIKIDYLQLRIGKVIYKDYSAGGKPKVSEYNININEVYKDIDNPSKIVSIIVVKALMNTTIGKLTGFDLGPLQGIAGDSLKGAQKVVGDIIVQGKQVISNPGAAGQKIIGDTGAQTQKFLGAAGKTGGKVVEGAGETVKDATKGITGAIGGLFGGKKE